MVPENTSYVADSLVVTSGANAGNKTDGGGDDQAEFDSANNQVQFRLGNGADAVNGGNLLIGENSSFRFRVQVNPGTPANSQIENVATADFVGLITGIPDTINSVPVISIVQVPELSIIKTSNPNPVAAGAPLVYTLSFTNIGTAPATGVVISDPLPAQTTFLSATGNGVLNGTTLIWNIGTLDAGESGSVSYIVRVDDPLPAGTTITNSAVIDSNQTPPITTQTVTPVTSTPVLELSKQASSSLVEAGSQLIYTLTFGNTGNEDASNVILSDTIPVNTTFVSASDNGVFDPSGNTVTWNLGILNAGASGSVTLTVQVVSPLPTGTVIANAAVIDSTETPPVSTQVQTPVGSAPVLNLSKDANSTVVGSGAQISYTLNYSNTGSEDASGVVLSDSIPPNTSFVSASDGGSFDAAANSVIWNLGLIAAGAGGSVSLTIQVDSSVPSGTPIINNAILTSNEVPPVNTQTQTPVASLPILTLNKQSDSETTTAGASLTYTLTYRNTGNVTATGVVLTDLLPPDTTFVAASNSGVFDPAANTVVWNLGTLVVAESGSVTVTIQIDAAAAAGSLIINLSDIVSAETPPVVAQALTPVGLVTIIIPTLSTLSLLMLAIMLGIFGMINRRYRI
jgi:uncharacterized repeat protein (TIGR01451 family)